MPEWVFDTNQQKVGLHNHFIHQTSNLKLQKRNEEWSKLFRTKGKQQQQQNYLKGLNHKCYLIQSSRTRNHNCTRPGYTNKITSDVWRFR